MRIRFAGLLAVLLIVATVRVSHAIPVVSAGSATVTVGDIFTIPISITDAVDLTSFQFDLSFTPSLLQVTPTGVAESPFFTQGGPTVFIPGLVDNINGEITLVADALTIQPSVNGSGDLAFIEFEAIAPGTSPLALSNVFLNFGLVTDFVVVNGVVCVNPAGANTCQPGGGNGQVPEPGTVVLLAVALSFLFWRRWKSTRYRYKTM
jgi:hypothetical protein